MKYIFFFMLCVCISLELCAQSPKEEIRAVWLTSNYSLDWPSKSYRNSDDINEQQDELIDILDKLKAANFNMIFIQTRLRGDVIYNSEIEPVSPFIRKVKNTWSKYDPLAFAVAECHKRGLECHAWFVTYPLGTEKIKGKENNSPTLKKNKDRAKRYKGEFYLDPGDPKTNDYLISLINEIVGKYDIDGIHLDYIRYPDANFPDEATYKRYGNGKNKSDWRRENVNRFVYKVYDDVKAKKPWVQVSSSVIGMYNKIKGSKRQYSTAYSVYQDPENWLLHGKQDFIVPMMYNKDDLFFPFIQDWKMRSNGRYIVPGLGLYQIDEKESNWSTTKIKEQIQYSRQNQMQGNAFYRARYLFNNKKGILNEIKTNFYQHPALLPPLTWLSTKRPLPPQNLSAEITGIYLYLHWEPVGQPQKEKVFYNVYRSEKWPVDTDDADNLVAVRINDQMLFVPVNNSIESGYYYAVTSYDRYHNESKISDPVYFVTGDFNK
ncbi:MAG: family 10 glycosylhydrolase [Candidatus Symbiothrix sp.]|jgi:uncharacterized lipoprotein YddW (UPF0748 family)|nr:family 10 glycosylhydrolase [Candidatus Symbiothrix sp.]